MALYRVYIFYISNVYSCLFLFCFRSPRSKYLSRNIRPPLNISRTWIAVCPVLLWFVTTISLRVTSIALEKVCQDMSVKKNNYRKHKAPQNQVHISWYILHVLANDTQNQIIGKCHQLRWPPVWCGYATHKGIRNMLHFIYRNIKMLK